MILTVTLNPSVDIAYQFESFETDTLNHPSLVRKTAGGKGLNVTRVLRTLNEEVKAAGFLGGTNGEFILNELRKANVRTAFESIPDDTRNCIAILHEGRQTEILEKGPLISHRDSVLFKRNFAALLNGCEAAVFSGSLPQGIDDTFYAELIEIAHASGITTVLDCSNAPLCKALKAEIKPDVIKPNIDELRNLLKREVSKEVSSLKAALLDETFASVPWVIVSLGKDGCFAKHHNTFYLVTIPSIRVVNPVGSGDSTVAGIASALVHNFEDEALLKHANTLGMLNAMEAETGCVNLKNYDSLYKQIIVRKV